MTKVWALTADEGWICDQLVDDFKLTCRDMWALGGPAEADVVWLLADWRWKSIPVHILCRKKVVTTVHHFVPNKFDAAARVDWFARDGITTLYHVYNERAREFMIREKLTDKPIELVRYWANQNLWRRSALSKIELRRKHELPEDARIIMSAQRDTEGSDLRTPKSEKGPDLLADALVSYTKIDPSVHVLLGGWRRQYVVARLEAAGVPYTYFERPPQETLCELYQCADLYPVTARHEGGPQSLIECGLLGVPVVSRPVGIAEQVLPYTAIAHDVTCATPAVPDVDSMKLPRGMEPYRELFRRIASS